MLTIGLQGAQLTETRKDTTACLIPEPTQLCLFSLFDNNYHFKTHYCHNRASLVVQTVKNLPAMWETQVGTLSQEDPLEKGMV